MEPQYVLQFFQYLLLSQKTEKTLQDKKEMQVIYSNLRGLKLPSAEEFLEEFTEYLERTDLPHWMKIKLIAYDEDQRWEVYEGLINSLKEAISGKRRVSKRTIEKIVQKYDLT